MPDVDAIEKLCRVARNFQLGLFCPAELWCQVIGVLEGEDAGRLLAGLPPETREALRRAYRDRPGSLWRDPGEFEVRRLVERWCRAGEA